MGAGVAQRLCNGLSPDGPGFGVKPELHVLPKGQLIGVPSINDLAVDGTLNTTNQPTITQTPITESHLPLRADESMLVFAVLVVPCSALRGLLRP